jgi:DNA replication protein DnaC
MRRYSPEEFKYLKGLREEIVGKHKMCDGKGYVKGGACTCSRVYSYIKDLTSAAIPRTYWAFKLSELVVDEAHKRFLKTYFDNFDNASMQALGFIFLGPNGVGKTAMMCEVGKEAIVRGMGVFYTTAQKFINLSYRDDRLRNLLLGPDIQVILLDEVDKAYIKEGSDFVPKTLEELLRSGISAGRIVVAASNEDEQGLETMFGSSTLSMIKRHLKIIPVTGDDFSEGRQDSWTKMLKDKVDWFHPNILEMAERRWEAMGEGVR